MNPLHARSGHRGTLHLAALISPLALVSLTGPQAFSQTEPPNGKLVTRSEPAPSHPPAEPKIKVPDFKVPGPSYEEMRTKDWFDAPDLREYLELKPLARQPLLSSAPHGLVHDYYSVVVESLPKGITAQSLFDSIKDSPSSVDSFMFKVMGVFDRAGVPGRASIGDTYKIRALGGLREIQIMNVGEGPGYFVVHTLDGTPAGDSPHLERGIRVFGFSDLGDGKVEFFTKGVSSPAGLAALAPGPVARTAQAFVWERFIAGIQSTVKEKGGTTGEVQAQRYIPVAGTSEADIKYQEDLLSGSRTKFFLCQGTVQDLSRRVAAGEKKFAEQLKRESKALDQVTAELAKALDSSPQLKKQLMPLIDMQVKLAKSGKSMADLNPQERKAYEALVHEVRSSVEGEFKKSREEIYKLVRKERQKEEDAAALAEIQRGLAITAEGASALVAVVATFDAKLARQMEIIFNSSIQISAGIARCLAQDYTGAFSIAKGIAGVFGLKTKDVGAERHREVMETLFSIRQEIAEVHREVVELRLDLHQVRKEMHDRFAVLDERLFQIQGELRRSFFVTFDTLQDLQFDAIESRLRDKELKELTEFFGMRTSEAIMRLNLTQFVDGMQLAFRERPTVEVNNPGAAGGPASEAVALSSREIEDLSLLFYRHAARTAKDPLMNGSDFKLEHLSPTRAETRLLESLPFARRFGFLGELYSGATPPNGAQVQRGLANPAEYVLGVEAYLSLRARNPDFKDSNLTDIDKMIEVGEELLAASKTLSSPELMLEQVQNYLVNLAAFRELVISEIIDGVTVAEGRPVPGVINVVNGKHVIDWHAAALSSVHWEQKKAKDPFATSSRESVELEVGLETVPPEIRLLIQNRLAVLQTEFSAEGYFKFVPPKKAPEHGQEGPRYKGPIDPVISHEVSFSLTDSKVPAKDRKVSIYTKTLDTKDKAFAERYTTKGKEQEVTEYKGNGEKIRTYLDAPRYLPPWHPNRMLNANEFVEVWQGKFDYILKQPIAKWVIPGALPARERGLAAKEVDGQLRIVEVDGPYIEYSDKQIKEINEKAAKSAEKRRLEYRKMCYQKQGLKEVFGAEGKVTWNEEAVDKARALNEAHYEKQEGQVKAGVRRVILAGERGRALLSRATLGAARLETLAPFWESRGAIVPALPRHDELASILSGSDDTLQDVLTELDSLVRRVREVKMTVAKVIENASAKSPDDYSGTNLTSVANAVASLKAFRDFEAARLKRESNP
jgi:hypothetical protein